MPDLASACTNDTDECGDAGTLNDLIGRGRPRWWRDAACIEHPELSWFVERGGDAQAPKKVCAGCLVRQECLTWATSHNLTVGIFGGLSPKQRRLLRPAPPSPRPARRPVYRRELEPAEKLLARLPDVSEAVP